LRAAATLVAALIAFGPHPAAAQAGLDVRPSNTSCFAPLLAAGSAEVRGVRAFPPLVFTGPTQIRQHPDDASRFYVLERRGLLRTFRTTSGDAVDEEAALDFRDRMAFTARDASDSEQWGATSFVFAPGLNATTGGFVYVAYNRRPAPGVPVRSSLSRFRSTDGRTFDPASEVEIFRLDQDRPWHHLGQLQFGADGALYLGSGDGAYRDRSQDAASPYGKILRFDLRRSPPAVTTFVSGLRNPWRFDFTGGALWVGDVGWRTWEEINRVPLDGEVRNYGWPIFEGPVCHVAGRCTTPGLVPPLHAFGPDVGISVIGGHVYAGTAVPALRGHYIFGAASSSDIFALTPGSGYRDRIRIGQLPSARITGFFEAADNEIYVNDTITGGVWRLLPADTGGGGGEVASSLAVTGCMNAADTRAFAAGVVPYAVNMPLWSDRLDKQRGVALPNGTAVDVDAAGDFSFPPRSVLLKSFFLEDRIVETRLFMNHPGPTGGWRGYSYEWGTPGAGDAQLLAAGKVRTFPTASGPVTWLYPSREQCFQCHTPAAGISLGLELAQIDRSFTYAATGRTANQLDTWRAIGMFAGPVPSAAAVRELSTRTTGTATRRARSYLHANCAYCHRPGGNARVNMDFRFAAPLSAMNVCDVPPSGELIVDGTRRLTPGDPAASTIWIRMNRRGDHQMPPLGTFVVDRSMVRTMASWIRATGSCD
jgi:uncharacterized repeat protein (TIGR03806 family)